MKSLTDSSTDQAPPTPRWESEALPFDVVLPDGAILRGQRAGSGPKILFVHGWTQNRSNWRWVGERLIEAGYEVIAYDSRGHGQSTRGEVPPSIEQLRDDLRRVFNHLVIDTAVVVGHSLGGATALAFAATGDDRVAGLTIVGSSSRFMNPSILKPGARLLAKALDPSLAGQPDPKKDFMSARVALGRKPERWAWQHTADQSGATDPAVVQTQFLEIIDTDLTDRLPLITVPTTVIGGKRDFLTPFHHSKAIHRGVPHSKLRMLDGCGHMVMLERVGIVVEEVLAVADATLKRVR